MWIQTDGGMCFIVLTAHGKRGRRVSVLIRLYDGMQEWIKSFILDHSNDAIQSVGQQNADGRAPYCAFVRLLPRVTSHVDHQHVLRLEGLLLAGTFLPAAHELLLLAVDVVVVDVLCGELQPLITAR